MMAQEKATAAPRQHRTPVVRFTPSAQVIEQLIRRAEKHPLGTDYLVNGSLDSVSATFGVHAFVVDAAREKLGHNGFGTRTGVPAVHVRPVIAGVDKRV